MSYERAKKSDKLSNTHARVSSLAERIRLFLISSAFSSLISFSWEFRDLHCSRLEAKLVLEEDRKDSAEDQFFIELEIMLRNLASIRNEYRDLRTTTT